MKVVVNGKTLWHIQNMNILSDGEPYDMFLWGENEPTEEELRRAFAEDYDEYSEYEMSEWLTSSSIYAVYASNDNVIQ